MNLDVRSHVLVMAKAPVPGRVKTRLCPPCSPREAAAVAEAALVDTLFAVTGCGADRLLLALDGPPGDWLPPGFEVFPQVAGGLDQRLAAAWATAGGPGVQIGMDTPQVSADVLDDALASVDVPGTAALGPAHDGGWWAIALHRPDSQTFIGVRTSTPDTGTVQYARLRRLGLSVALLPSMRDIDTIDDALTVATDIPESRTAAAVHTIAAIVAVSH